MFTKNGDYSNVQDLVLDRDAAISAAIILVSYYRIAGPRASFGIKNVYFEGIEVFKTSIFHKLRTIRKIMHFSEFQADFDMSKWL